MAPFDQQLAMEDLRPGCIRAVLKGLAVPPLGPLDALRQLDALENYVLRHVSVLADGAATGLLAMEAHYIDRDHMEDHSVFYSRSFFPYPNSSRRLHFFALSREAFNKEYLELLAVGRDKGEEAFAKKCEEFSHRYYLGFSTIKPLGGCPVGRTVLRCFPKEVGGMRDEYPCIRDYTVHFIGLALKVRGLPFQQQDKAVSACATTAIWSSLAMAGEHEEAAAATPAVITARASANSLPFGRAMPSEGLDVNQMCQAVQSAGASPLLLVAKTFEATRGLLYSALKSRIAAILVLSRPDGDRHAVTVAGMQLSKDDPVAVKGVADRASAMKALYLHDDRLAPYLRATVRKVEDPSGRSAFQVFMAKADRLGWTLTQMLLPLHAKIRLSFHTLRGLALKLTESLRVAMKEDGLPADERPWVRYDVYIQRSSAYVHDLLVERKIDLKAINLIVTKASLPRYLGLIRLELEDGALDFLVDTTSTERNPHLVGMVVLDASSKRTVEAAGELGARLGCWVA